MLDEQLEIEDVEEDIVSDVEEAEELEDASPADADGDSDTEARDDDEGEEETPNPEVSDEILISLDGEDDSENDTSVIRSMRQKLKEAETRAKEAERKLAEAAPSKKVELGPEPKLEDFDYDGDAFKAALADWFGRKAEVDRQEAEKRAKMEQVQTVFAKRLEGYQARKAELKVPDYDSAESEVTDKLTIDQQNVLVLHSNDPAIVVLALAKNPKLLDDLSGTEDLVEFGVKLARMESKMRVTQGTKISPEKRPKGKSASVPGTTERNLDKLRAKAEETGDWTDYFNAKRKSRK